MDDKSPLKKIVADALEPAATTIADPVTPGHPDASLPSASLASASLPSASRPTASILALEPARRARAARIRRRPPPRVRVEEHIGRQLRSLYDDILAQPVPDRFVDLLAQLAARSRKPDGDDVK